MDSTGSSTRSSSDYEFAKYPRHIKRTDLWRNLKPGYRNVLDVMLTEILVFDCRGCRLTYADIGELAVCSPEYAKEAVKTLVNTGLLIRKLTTNSRFGNFYRLYFPVKVAMSTVL